MTHNTLRPAILIVSDTASENPSTDKSINALSSLLTAEGQTTWDQPTTKIVPDNALEIQRAVCDWTDGPDWFNLILLSGGTGFAVRDNTPEVRRRFIADDMELMIIGCVASYSSPCFWTCVSILCCFFICSNR